MRESGWGWEGTGEEAGNGEEGGAGGLAWAAASGPPDSSSHAPALLCPFYYFLLLIDFSRETLTCCSTFTGCFLSMPSPEIKPPTLANGVEAEGPSGFSGFTRWKTEAAGWPIAWSLAPPRGHMCCSINPRYQLGATLVSPIPRPISGRSCTHACIHSWREHLRSTSGVPGTVLGHGDTGMSKTESLTSIR